jgi:hypothetical protein
LGAYPPVRYVGVVAGENTLEDEVSTTATFQLGAMESNPVASVQRFCEPLFVIFDFSAVPFEIYRGIVNDFMNGKVS